MQIFRVNAVEEFSPGPTLLLEINLLEKQDLARKSGNILLKLAKPPISFNVVIIDF